MHEQRWCYACNKISYDCTCTSADIERADDERRLDDLRNEVAYLERKLGVSAAFGGNRKQRRASSAQARRR